jgi:hypothetical protein
MMAVVRSVSSIQHNTCSSSRAGAGSVAATLMVHAVKVCSNCSASSLVPPSVRNAASAAPSTAAWISASWKASLGGSAAAASASSSSVGWPWARVSTQRPRAEFPMAGSTVLGPGWPGSASVCSNARRCRSSRTSSRDSSRDSACIGWTSTVSGFNPAGTIRLVRITRDGPSWSVSAPISGAQRRSRH